MNTLQDMLILVFDKDPMKIIECLKVTYTLCVLKVQKRDRGNICKRVEELFNIQWKSYDTPMILDDLPERDESGAINHDDHSRY